MVFSGIRAAKAPAIPKPVKWCLFMVVGCALFYFLNEEVEHRIFKGATVSHRYIQQWRSMLHPFKLYLHRVFPFPSLQCLPLEAQTIVAENRKYAAT